MTRPSRRMSRVRSVALGAVFILAGGTAATITAHATAASPPSHGSAAASPRWQGRGGGGHGQNGNGRQLRDVQANLWEWNWPSVAKECTTVLGPNGYGGVQVAPPADSLSRDYTTPDAPILHPWWDVYQPVDYNLTSRFGNEQEFRDMVSTCRAAGVKVYVDAVINHMTGQGHKSYGGVEYTHFNYPGLYGYNDFHHQGTGPNDCPSTDGGVDNYNDYHQLTKCELLGLADLRTDYQPTRAKIVAYLNKLISYGVSGFRVDAAKHIGIEDLLAIKSQLHRTADGTAPEWALENFPGSPGEASQYAFTRAGMVLGFDFAYQIKNAYKSYTSDQTGNISTLRVFGEAAGLVPSDKSLVFIENHDTERGSDTLSYKDGATNVIANEFMLAYGYGTPQVYSAFAFTNSYDSPPSDANGYVTNTDCSNGWVCVDRYRGILGMVGFHNYVGKAPVNNEWDDTFNVIGFARGNRGYFITNNGNSDKTVTVDTGLPSGTYCDVMHGGAGTDGVCSGTAVRVGPHGMATITVPAKNSVAIDRAARV